MSKTPNKSPMKMEKGSSDHRRESSGGRNDRVDKTHSHSRSDSSSRGKHSDHHASKELASNANSNRDEDDGDKNETKSAEEKKFTGRCRLFVGNLTPDVSEDDFKKMFQAYGEVSEVYVNSSRGFGFIRLDYRQNAEAAKAALDGLQRKGRVLRVRFATHGAALKVKNLHPYVSNELLEQAFTQFGELERAIVIVDDRGKPTGEGLVEFVRKPGAQQALRRITEGVFLFGADPKPIEVEPLEQKDEEDGMPEKFLPKNEQYKKEREKDPHFAPHTSFEYEFGMRWKQLAEMEKKRIESVKREMEEARIKLEDEMQNALYDYQAEQIRQDLMRQQEELRRLEELRNQDRMRRQKELEMRSMSRRAEEERERQQDERRRQEMMMRQQEMQRRSGGGPMDSGMSRRDDMMTGMRGDGASGFQGGPGGMGMRGGQNQSEPQMRGGRGGAPPLQPPPAPPAGMGLERGQPGMGMERGPQGMGMDRGPQGMGMDRGPQGMGMERGPQGMGMDRGPQGVGMDRGPQGVGMDRGPQGVGMERGPQGVGMERGPQGVGMERGQQNMPGERGQQGLGMDRGQPGLGSERPQQGLAMERNSQQGIGRMQQGVGGQTSQGNFGGQGSLPANGSNGDPSSGGSPSINSMGKIGSQGGPGSQMEADTTHSHNYPDPLPSSNVDNPFLLPGSAGMEEWTSAKQGNSSYEQSQSDLQNDLEDAAENYIDHAAQDCCSFFNIDSTEFSNHTCDEQGPFPQSLNTESGNGIWCDEYLSGGSGCMLTNTDDLLSGVCSPATNELSAIHSSESDSKELIDIISSGRDTNELLCGMSSSESTDCLFEERAVNTNHSCSEEQSSKASVNKRSCHNEQKTLCTSEESVVACEDKTSSSACILRNAEVCLADSLVASEANACATDLCSGCVGTSKSSSPVTTAALLPGPVAATGIPFVQRNPAYGNTCFLRVVPVHSPAVVASQRRRAAVVAQQQQSQMAAMARWHAVASAQHQMAAAAVQRRTGAALLPQQLIRSQYMGAPVVVRPTLVPLPRLAAPVRVQMRLHRSVVMTEEVNLHPK